MNETDVIFSIAKELDISYKEANDQVHSILNCITNELLNGGKVKLVDFGNFEVVQRVARKGHNPHTHEVFDIPACLEPVFKPGKQLKDMVKDAENM